MAESEKGRGGPIPVSARFGSGWAAPIAGLSGDTKAPTDPESARTKAGSSGPKNQAARGPGLRTGVPQPGQISVAVVREARRRASDGARLVHEGRTTEAISMLERSLQLDPTVAAPHHDLGIALLAAGRIEQAAVQFTAALRIDPKIATAHYCLGYIFDSLGRQGKALQSFQSAVALNPHLVTAQLRLGDLYLSRGQRVRSAAAFRAAAAAANSTAMARIAEARALEVSGAFDEALAEMRAVVEAHPADAEPHAYLARLLGEAGLAAEAAAQYERAVELNPGMIDAWSGLATNKKFNAADGPLIERMNAALSRPGATPRHKLLLHFALGKARDDIGDYEAAMRDFEAGNRLRALGSRFRREKLAEYFDRLIEASPLGYRAGHTEVGVEDPTPILIVGMPRSGTTLVEQILSSHPEIAAGGELSFWGVRESRGDDIPNIKRAPETARRLVDNYLPTLRAFGPNAKRITDKAIGVYTMLGVVHLVFPNATIIHCRRHPIDTALSIFTTNFERNFDYASDRGTLAFYYRQYERLMAHWREVLPADRFVEVDYEALVADPEPHARRLVAATGLTWDDACLAPHKNPRMVNTASLWQVRQPIYRTSVERWRRYEPWLGELRELTTDP